MLQHREIEVYISKHHIWLFVKKKQMQNKVWLPYNDKSVYYILSAVEKLFSNFYKEQLHNI